MLKHDKCTKWKGTLLFCEVKLLDSSRWWWIFLLGNLRRTTPFTFTHLFVMVPPTGRWWTQIIRYLKSRNEFNWRKAEAFSRVVFHSKRQSAIIIYFRWIFLTNNFWCILHTNIWYWLWNENWVTLWTAAFTTSQSNPRRERFVTKKDRVD